MAIYLYICFWSGINSRNFCVLESVKGKKKKKLNRIVFSQAFCKPMLRDKRIVIVDWLPVDTKHDDGNLGQ